MGSLIHRHTTVILLLVTGLLPSVIVNFSTGAHEDARQDARQASESATKIASESSVQANGPPLDGDSIRPYQMVAHSNHNDRILNGQFRLSSGGEEEHRPPLSLSTTSATPQPTRTRSKDLFTRRIRQSPSGNELIRAAPSRYYDSYGVWHHGDEDQHWEHPLSHSSHGTSHPHHAWQHHQHHQQHHGNPLLLGGTWEASEITQVRDLYQRHALLNLQLLVVLQSFLMLGTLSLLVCLSSAVQGLLEKLKLPLVRTSDDLISAGSAPAPTGLRDEQDKHYLEQLLQFLHGALEQQQLANNQSVIHKSP